MGFATSSDMRPIWSLYPSYKCSVQGRTATATGWSRRPGIRRSDPWGAKRADRPDQGRPALLTAALLPENPAASDVIISRLQTQLFQIRWFHALASFEWQG